MVTASLDGTARIWDADSGAPLAILRGHGDVVVSAAFSPDGERVVTAASTTDGADLGRRQRRAARPCAATRGVCRQRRLQPRRRAGGDRQLRRHGADLGRRERRELEALRGHAGLGQSAAFSPDGERVVTASWRNGAIWECGIACESVPSLLELAPRLAGTLSDSERARYLPE